MSVPLDWFRWLNPTSLHIFGVTEPNVVGAPLLADTTVFIDREYGERLSAVTQLRNPHAVRIGWLFVTGTIEDKGRRRKVFHPLVTAPVKIWRPPISGRAQLTRFADVHLTSLITDRHRRHELERHIEFGGGALDFANTQIDVALLAKLPRLQRFAKDAAAAAGFTTSGLIPASASPESLMQRDGLTIVAGVGLYVNDADVSDMSRAGSLRYWANDAVLPAPTALHTLYFGAPVAGEPEPTVLRLPTRLSPTQAKAVVSSRAAPITVVSGAPGTGKSHTLAAIALDAVGRGENVLVVAKTDASVDALIDLLQRSPGPEPVVFGSNERRNALADRLSGGALHPVRAEQVRDAQRRADDAWLRLATYTEVVEERLRCEALLAEGRFFDPGESLGDVAVRADRIAVLLDEATKGGFLRRGKVRRAREGLARLLAVSTVDSWDALADAARDELHRIAARQLVAAPERAFMEEQWRHLADAATRARDAEADYLSVVCRSDARLDAAALAAVSALAVALRSGRAARREQLRRLGQSGATRALPLWIGTLADVDDLLPPQAGFFDLVILDESASIDQPLAAPALLRGKRAVIAGDPRQLRQASFLSDAELARAMEAASIEDPVLIARLDVRRNSVLDLAIGVAPPIVLDEHFRSDPHLIDFVARRLYKGDLKVASRRPTTEGRDCIDVVRVDGQRTAEGVVSAEVKAVLEAIRRHRYNNTGIGVVTPFRAQADAIEAAILKAYTADEIESMDLRVGTVHGFQGNERDLVIASVGVGDDNAAGWRFVEDPSLAAVLLTRARRHLVVVYSGEPPERGLIADFLRQENTPPSRAAAREPASAWVRSIRDGAALAGVPLWPGYPSGRHEVDLVLDDTSRDVAIECDIHPSGPASHIRRRLDLMDRGWDFFEALRSQWIDREAELVVDLVNRLKR